MIQTSIQQKGDAVPFKVPKTQAIEADELDLIFAHQFKIRCVDYFVNLSRMAESTGVNLMDIPLSLLGRMYLSINVVDIFKQENYIEILERLIQDGHSQIQIDHIWSMLDDITLAIKSQHPELYAKRVEILMGELDPDSHAAKSGAVRSTILVLHHLRKMAISSYVGIVQGSAMNADAQ